MVFIALFMTIALSSCEDVIEVEVPTGESRLIVDALTRIDLNDELIPFEIKVTTTTNFFEEIPVTSLERMVLLVEVTDENGFTQTGVATFIEIESGTGVYIPDPCCEINKVPTSVLDFDVIFRLIIEHEGKKYYAETRYVPVVPIDSVILGGDTLFDSDGQEVVVSFKDDPEIENNYLFDFDFDEYLLTDDEFYSGQDFEFSYFYDRSFDPGTKIDISILGIDKPFSNYMAQLIEQSEQPQGPFQTPVTTVRGNVFDITGLDNRDIFDNVERPNDYALGYFAIVQELKTSLIIE